MIGHDRRIIGIVLAGGYLTASLPALAWTPDELKRLRAGDVVIESRQQPRGGIVDGSIVVQAPPRLVYTLVADPQQMQRYSPEIASVKIIEDQDLQKRVRIRIKQFGLIDEEQEVISTFRPYEQVAWRQVKGRFAHQNGSWQMNAFDKGTLLHYHLDIDVGTHLPGFIVTAFLRTTIPSLLRSVRNQFGPNVWLRPPIFWSAAMT